VCIEQCDDIEYHPKVTIEFKYKLNRYPGIVLITVQLAKVILVYYTYFKDNILLREHILPKFYNQRTHTFNLLIVNNNLTIS
jgi:hypothetical protein